MTRRKKIVRLYTKASRQFYRYRDSICQDTICVFLGKNTHECKHLMNIVDRMNTIRTAYNHLAD